MEHPKAVKICTLKVKINCCTMCQLKAKEKLQGFNGVESVVCDSKGVVTMSGKVNPMTIVKKIEKWGKKAELLSLQKSPNQEGQATGIDDFDNGSHPKMNKDCCCHCEAISDSDNHDNDCEVLGSKKGNPNITLQNPDLTMNKQSTMSKSKKGLFGLFSKKGGGAKRKSDGATMLGKPSMADGPFKWRFPRIPVPEYGGPSPRPYYQPFGPSASPYHQFGLMRLSPPPPLVVPPPYGFFNSRPPPKVNPMIHYTSYADNYSHW